MRFACRMNHAAPCASVYLCVFCKVLLLPFRFADVHKAHGLPDVGFAARGLFMQAAERQRSPRGLRIKCHVKCSFLNFVNSGTCAHC